nr:hypothetical protein CFP56_69883 [Quercus suber]
MRAEIGIDRYDFSNPDRRTSSTDSISSSKISRHLGTIDNCAPLNSRLLDLNFNSSELSELLQEYFLAQVLALTNESYLNRLIGLPTGVHAVVKTHVWSAVTRNHMCTLSCTSDVLTWTAPAFILTARRPTGSIGL